MFDDIPPPFGDVTRQWTQLNDQQRQRHAARMLGSGCPPGPEHVRRPQQDDGACYARLVAAAAAGDSIAFAWLATSHRPILLVRGRAIYDHDPSEWGAVAIEALHQTVTRVDVSIGVWLRRRVVQHSCRFVSRRVDQYLARRAHEIATDPADLAHTGWTPVQGSPDPHLDLSIALDEALARLDAPTRDAFLALANHRPLDDVVDRYHLTYDTVRNRVKRARVRLQPQLAGYVRAVDR